MNERVGRVGKRERHRQTDRQREETETQRQTETDRQRQTDKLNVISQRYTN